MSRWLKEPLLHFLLIGACLFVLFYQVADPESVADNRIRIGAADIERMVVLFERQRQRLPSPQEVDGLIEAQIREEVLYREALAMGLPDDDTIVRRRMAQKMEFLFNDLVAATLGWMQVPQQPVEAVIALSILFLATEIVHGLRGRPALTARQPWIVAFVFGLLHGFGFA